MSMYHENEDIYEGYNDVVKSACMFAYNYTALFKYKFESWIIVLQYLVRPLDALVNMR